jgi:hypothetical protein
LNGVESDHSAGYYGHGPILRAIKQGFGNNTRSPSYYSIVLFTYDDAARITQVTTKFGNKEQLIASSSHSHDFVGRLTKLNNAMIIRKEHAVQVIHPNVRFNNRLFEKFFGCFSSKCYSLTPWTTS